MSAQRLRHFLSVIQALDGAPVLREQRRAITNAAIEALPEGRADGILLALGIGGELSQLGAAEAILTAILPGSMFMLWSEVDGDERTYFANVSADGVYRPTLTPMAERRPSAGQALVIAMVVAMIEIAERS